jgi:uncharacterized membrane protein YuzA (DUF378 family)
MSKCGPVGSIAMLLVVIGAINWGLVGALNFDLVAYLFMDLIEAEVVARIVYILVGVSGLVVAAGAMKKCE